MPNDNINVTMAYVSIGVPPAMSFASARCEALGINPTVHVVSKIGQRYVNLRQDSGGLQPEDIKCVHLVNLRNNRDKKV